MPRKAKEDIAAIYRKAAQEHITLAIELHEAGRYVMAHYIAGLSVECILRAFRYRIDPVFDSRHNLEMLYADAHFDDRIPLERRAEVGTALTEVVRRWNNNHRYRSEQALQNYLRQAGLGRTGKFVRESSRRIVNAAITIAEQGDIHWND